MSIEIEYFWLIFTINEDSGISYDLHMHLHTPLYSTYRIYINKLGICNKS